MQPDTRALLTNLVDEAPPREFVTAMRGYDRHQVDEHIRQIQAEVRQHREQAQAMHRELSEARRQFHEQERPAYTGLGARIEQLLRLAEEQATEVIQAARSEANEIKATAKVNASELRAGAENEASELRANAKRETDDQRSAAVGRSGNDPYFCPTRFDVGIDGRAPHPAIKSVMHKWVPRSAGSPSDTEGDSLHSTILSALTLPAPPPLPRRSPHA